MEDNVKTSEHCTVALGPAHGPRAAFHHSRILKLRTCRAGSYYANPRKMGMDGFLVFVIVTAAFAALVLAWFIISSCLGDEIRAAWNGRQHTTPTTYGLQYAQYIGQGGPASYSEQIELDEMINGRFQDRRDD